MIKPETCFMKKDKTFVFVCGYKSLYGGNFIPLLLSLAKELKEKKNEKVCFIFPLLAAERNWINYIKSLNYEVRFFDSSFSRIKRAKELKKLLKELNPHIVYSHFMAPLIIKKACSFDKSIELVIHIHSDFSAGRKLSVKEKLILFIEKRTKRDAKFLGVSKNILEKQNRKNGYYIPNSIVLSRVPCKTKSREEMRKELGLNADDVLILMFSWSPFVKGLDVAVKAMDLVNKKAKNVKLLAVCGYDNGIENNKKFILDKTGIDPNSNYLLFETANEDVFRFHNASDIFLSSSRSEGFSFGLLEALCCDKLAIVSDIEGTKWSYEYKPVVSEFKSEDGLDLANKILAMIDWRKQNKKPNISDMIKEKYNVSNWVKSVMEVIYE